MFLTDGLNVKYSLTFILNTYVNLEIVVLLINKV